MSENSESENSEIGVSNKLIKLDNLEGIIKVGNIVRTYVNKDGIRVPIDVIIVEERTGYVEIPNNSYKEREVQEGALRGKLNSMIKMSVLPNDKYNSFYIPEDMNLIKHGKYLIGRCRYYLCNS